MSIISAPVILWLSLGLLLTPFGAIKSQSKSSPNASDQSEFVDFCALVDRPSEYSDRRIRIKVVLVELNKTVVDGGAPTLYAPACRNKKRLVGVQWSDKSYDNSTAAESLRDIRKHSDEFQVSRASVVMSGRLSGLRKGGYGHLGGLDLLFTVDDVESADPIPANAPWPKRIENAYRMARKLLESSEKRE